MNNEVKKISLKKRLLQDAIVSLPVAILLMVFLNIYWNWNYTYGFGDDFTMKMSLKHHDGRNAEPHDEVVAVNVSYDKVFVDKVRKGRYSGKGTMTDRKKLNDFLTALKEHDGYRYVLLDVDFSAGNVSEYDDNLFQTIASMRDIVVATSNPESDPEMIREKTAKAFYHVRMPGDDFLKYTYMDADSGEPSIALRMWQDITGGTYEKKRVGYRMNGRKCYNSIILDFKFMMLDELKHTDQQQKDAVQIQNLGADILTSIQYVDDYISLFDDKIVLIGDWFEYDLHDTIAGPQPGTVIIYNAYLSLVNGDNLRSFWVMLALTIILWVIVMLMLKEFFNIRFERWQQNFTEMMAGRKALYMFFKLLSYAGVFVTYMLPLKCFEKILYWYNGTIINTLALSVIFTILSEIISELNEIKFKK